jgi:hypothetical protein
MFANAYANQFLPPQFNAGQFNAGQFSDPRITGGPIVRPGGTLPAPTPAPAPVPVQNPIQASGPYDLPRQGMRPLGSPEMGNIQQMPGQPANAYAGLLQRRPMMM